MRNLVYRVGPKTYTLPSSGHGPKFLGSNYHASKHCYLLGFCFIGTPEAPQEVDIGHLWSYYVSYTSNLVSKLGPIWHQISSISSLMTPEKAATSLQCQQNTPSKS